MALDSQQVTDVSADVSTETDVTASSSLVIYIFLFNAF